jgi:hypothetical protein
MADPINYCSWLVKSFCVTQSEWASWTQAGGSILALGIAIVVPVVLHAREQVAQQQRSEQDRLNRERLARIQAKAAASSVLPFARSFLGELQSVMSQMTYTDIEEYNDIADVTLNQKLGEFRALSLQLATMEDVGELAMDAIASTELFLRTLGDWQFYEQYTKNGVFEDAERGYHEVFDKPPELLPILRAAIARTNSFLGRADAMFD